MGDHGHLYGAGDAQLALSALFGGGSLLQLVVGLLQSFHLQMADIGVDSQEYEADKEPAVLQRPTSAAGGAHSFSRASICRSGIRSSSSLHCEPFRLSLCRWASISCTVVRSISRAMATWHRPGRSSSAARRRYAPSPVPDWPTAGHTLLAAGYEPCRA